jgi:hypothetical protein
LFFELTIDRCFGLIIEKDEYGDDAQALNKHQDNKLFIEREPGEIVSYFMDVNLHVSIVYLFLIRCQSRKVIGSCEQENHGGYIKRTE